MIIFNIEEMKDSYIIYIFLLIALLFESCRDNEVIPLSGIESDNGYLYIDIRVLRSEKIQTRSEKRYDEFKISDLTFLVFNNGGNLIQKETLIKDIDFSVSETNGKISFINSSNVKFVNREGENFLKISADAGKNVEIYVVANATPLVNDLTIKEHNITDLTSLTNDDLESEKENGFMMAGFAQPENNRINISLKRTAAKITVELNDAFNSDFSLTGFSILNSLPKGYLTAPCTGESNIFYELKEGEERMNLESKEMKETEDLTLHTVFCYPTRGVSEKIDQNKGFIIIEGLYKGNMNFYRLDLRKAEGDSYKYLDIEPNNWYEIKINSVTRPGYSTASEAAKHPYDSETGIDYYIVDHSQDVLSFISDGLHVLGVSAGIVYNENDFTSGGENSSEVLSGRQFIVSCLSNNKEDLPYFIDNLLSKISVSIKEGSEWMALQSHSIEYNFDWEMNGDALHEETYKATLKYTLSFNSQNIKGGVLNGLISIDWMGLNRIMPVAYTSSFDPEEVVTSSSLHIYDEYSSLKYSIGMDVTFSETETYLGFLKGQSNTIQENKQSIGSYQLYGISTKDMGRDKIRDAGFHFPMLYGDIFNDKGERIRNTNPWYYQYVLSFYKLSDKYNYYFSIEADNPEDLNWWKNYLYIGIYSSSGSGTKIEWDTKNKEYLNDLLGIELKNNIPTSDEDALKYTTAKLVLTLIPPQTGKEEIYKFDLYHTGFFHIDDGEKGENKYRLDNKKKGVYYYEVVNINGKYWLDRNLGAYSNGDFVSDNFGSNLLGDNWPGSQGATGGYYLGNEEIGIPGYRIPQKTEWNDLILSERFDAAVFHTRDTEYNSSFYKSLNNSIGYIYFPKSGYYENGNPKYSECGYYWALSKTGSNAGNEYAGSLTGFKLNGKTGSFLSVNPDKDGLNVRLISKISDDRIAKEKYPVNFNVSGATHVYVYSYSGNSGDVADKDLPKKGEFSWPGKIIGDYISMQPNEDGECPSVNFSYESNLPEDELYVLFSYVNKNGKIFVISSNGEDNLSKAKGWKVINGASYSFSLSTDESGNVTGFTSVSIIKQEESADISAEIQDN